MNQRKLTTKEKAIKIFEAAVEAVHPGKLLREYLYADNKELKIGGEKWNKDQIGKLLIISTGKAAVAMALAAEEILSNLINKGLCITKYGHTLPLQKFTIIESAHPVPDENSIKAAGQIERLLEGCKSGDIVLVLLSGGASSLIGDFPQGCTLEDMQKLNQLLINSGASIHEINTVRKHISTLKGGQLTRAAYPAQVLTLAISDVVDDNPGIIASGPTVPDESTLEDAVKIFHKYNLWNELTSAVKLHFENWLNEIAETPKPGDPLFKNSVYKIIANNSLALEGAKIKAEMLCYNTYALKEKMTSDVEDISKQLVNQFIRYDRDKPACILLGGETVLNVKGSGKGGRAQHLVLHFLLELSHYKTLKNPFTILAAGTDGGDGPTDAAGAVGDIELIESAKDDAVKCLENFDSYHFLEKTGGLIKTGPTQTNVGDIIILLIE